MTDHERTIEIAEVKRRAIFLSLVTAQDGRCKVRLSRDRVSREFKVTIKQIQAIEREGIEHEWPPFDVPDEIVG